MRAWVCVSVVRCRVQGLPGIVPGVLQPAFCGWCEFLAAAAAVCVVCMENRVVSWRTKGLLGVIQCTPTYICL